MSNGNPTFVVIRDYVVFLRTLMPSMPQRQGRTVPVHYVHPGDKHDSTAMVWVDNIDDSYTIPMLRAGVRRRKADVRFDLVIGVELVGQTVGDEATALQFQADGIAHQIRNAIDLDIATEEHLHSPDKIDVAWVVGSRTDRGLTATGAGVRLTLTVGFTAQFTD